MKRKVQSLMAAFAASALLVPGVHAQTDLTHLLTNPDFEIGRDGVTLTYGALERGDPYGWTRVGDLNGQSWGTNDDAEGYFQQGKSLCWYNSDPMPDFFELYQTVTGLEPGDYMVTCKLAIFDDRKSTQRIFANNNVQYFLDEESYVNVLGEYPDEDNTYAGLITTIAHVERAVLQDMVVMTTIKEGEDLKLGVRSSNHILSTGERNYTTNYGWFKVDDFRLYHLTEGIIGYYRPVLNQLINTYSNVNASNVPKGDYKALTEHLEYAMDIYENSDDAEEVRETVFQFERIYKEVFAGEKSWDNLLDLIEDNHEFLLELELPGLDEYMKEWAAAVSLFEDADAKRADFDQAYLDYSAAISAYRYTGFATGTIDEPFDATWYVNNPTFDEKAKGWTLTNGFQTQNTGDRYNLNFNFVENWVSGNENKTLPNSSVYQTILDLPNGIYEVEASVIACNQGYAPEEEWKVNGVYLFGNTTLLEVSTQEEEDYNKGVRKTFRVVVTNGELILGMKTIETSASWVALDSILLYYYGDQDLASYETAYANQLAAAKKLFETLELLPMDEKALNDVIKASEEADRSTVEKIQVVLDNLRQIIVDTEKANQELVAFKAGSYEKIWKIIENSDNIYTEELTKLMEEVLVRVNIKLASEETTAEDYPAMTEELNEYLTFVDSYQALNEFRLLTGERELVDLIEIVLTDQVNEVVDPAKIEKSKSIFAWIISFSNTYERAAEAIMSDRYSQSAMEKLLGVMEEQIEIVKEDVSKAPAAENLIIAALAEMRSEKIEIGEEVTNLYVVNPVVDVAGRGIVPQGWTIDQGTSANICNFGEHWLGQEENTYFDGYNGVSGALRYHAYQVVKGIPNGKYKLVAKVRAWGEGAYLYGKGSGMKIFKEEIPSDGNKYGKIWEDAADGSPEQLANNGEGYGWAEIFVSDINVAGNILIIGVTTNPELTDDQFTGQWFSADDFQLFYVSEEYDDDTSVRDLNSEKEELIVFAENGYLTVEGADQFTVTTLSGIQVLPSAQLAPGIYIVKAGTKTAKVWVK